MKPRLAAMKGLAKAEGELAVAKEMLAEVIAQVEGLQKQYDDTLDLKRIFNDKIYN